MDVPPTIRTRVTELLGMRYPIVQAPMGSVDAVRPVADLIHDTMRDLVQAADGLSTIVAAERMPRVGFPEGGDERPRAAREVSTS